MNPEETVKAQLQPSLDAQQVASEMKQEQQKDFAGSDDEKCNVEEDTERPGASRSRVIPVTKERHHNDIATCAPMKEDTTGTLKADSYAKHENSPPPQQCKDNFGLIERATAKLAAEPVPRPGMRQAGLSAGKLVLAQRLSSAARKELERKQLIATTCHKRGKHNGTALNTSCFVKDVDRSGSDLEADASECNNVYNKRSGEVLKKEVNSVGTRNEELKREIEQAKRGKERIGREIDRINVEVAELNKAKEMVSSLPPADRTQST